MSRVGEPVPQGPVGPVSPPPGCTADMEEINMLGLVGSTRPSVLDNTEALKGYLLFRHSRGTNVNAFPLLCRAESAEMAQLDCSNLQQLNHQIQ